MEDDRILKLFDIPFHRELDWDDNLSMWVFCSENYELASLPPNQIGPNQIVPDVTDQKKLKSMGEKFIKSLLSVRTKDTILIQLWIPVVISNQTVLLAAGQPFGVSKLDNGLLRYRDFCLKHCIRDSDTNKLVARVFKSLEKEMNVPFSDADNPTGFGIIGSCGIPILQNTVCVGVFEVLFGGPSREITWDTIITLSPRMPKGYRLFTDDKVIKRRKKKTGVALSIESDDASTDRGHSEESVGHCGMQVDSKDSEQESTDQQSNNAQYGVGVEAFETHGQDLPSSSGGIADAGGLHEQTAGLAFDEQTTCVPGPVYKTWLESSSSTMRRKRKTNIARLMEVPPAALLEGLLTNGDREVHHAAPLLELWMKSTQPLQVVLDQEEEIMPETNAEEEQNAKDGVGVRPADTHGQDSPASSGGTADEQKRKTTIARLMKVPPTALLEGLLTNGNKEVHYAAPLVQLWMRSTQPPGLAIDEQTTLATGLIYGTWLRSSSSRMRKKRKTNIARLMEVPPTALVEGLLTNGSREVHYAAPLLKLWTEPDQEEQSIPEANAEEEQIAKDGLGVQPAGSQHGPDSPASSCGIADSVGIHEHTEFVGVEKVAILEASEGVPATVTEQQDQTADEGLAADDKLNEVNHRKEELNVLESVRGIFTEVRRRAEENKAELDGARDVVSPLAEREELRTWEKLLTYLKQTIKDACDAEAAVSKAMSDATQRIQKALDA